MDQAPPYFTTVQAAWKNLYISKAVTNDSLICTRYTKQTKLAKQMF